MSVAAERTLSNHLCPLPDGPAVLWHESVPKKVRRCLADGRESAGWKMWKRHLCRRKKPLELSSLLPDGNRALAWGLPDGANSAQLSPSALQKWLDDADGGAWNTDYALSALTWCWMLPKLAEDVPADSWWALLNHLLRTAAEAATPENTNRMAENEPWLHQLLAGELPLSLAYWFPEIAACQAMQSAAYDTLSVGLLDLLDGEGLLHARHFGQMRPLLACWTRCRAIGERMRGGCWTVEAERQYRWLVRNALRLSRRDGSFVFSEAPAGETDLGLWKTALRLGGDEDDLAIAAAVLPGWKKQRRRPNIGISEAAIHSEWAAAALLQPDWSRSAPRLTVLYPDSSCRTELSCGKDVLWSGEWGLNVRIDGVPAEPADEWQEVCWISDEDVDYLELEIDLDEGLRVQRHILLARKDRFLLLADAVLGTRKARLEYRGTLPLCPSVTFSKTCETREGTLVGCKPRAVVLPLALPQGQADRNCGELTQTAAGLELIQASEGRSLFAPLLFDLDRRRMAGPLAWRRLTVAESLVVQPADVAAGFRVAMGKKQWLIYRSLEAKANRTLLGHNLSTEMLVARFDRQGEVEPLIEIE